MTFHGVDYGVGMSHTVYAAYWMAKTQHKLLTEFIMSNMPELGRDDHLPYIRPEDLPGDLVEAYVKNAAVRRVLAETKYTGDQKANRVFRAILIMARYMKIGQWLDSGGYAMEVRHFGLMRARYRYDFLMARIVETRDDMVAAAVMLTDRELDEFIDQVAAGLPAYRSRVDRRPPHILPSTYDPAAAARARRVVPGSFAPVLDFYDDVSDLNPEGLYGND
jgi:hypothetical protein